MSDHGDIVKKEAEGPFKYIYMWKPGRIWVIIKYKS